MKAVEEHQPEEKESDSQDSGQIAEEVKNSAEIAEEDKNSAEIVEEDKKDVEIPNAKPKSPSSSEETRGEANQEKYSETRNLVMPESSSEVENFISEDKKKPESTESPALDPEKLDATKDGKDTPSELVTAEESELGSPKDSNDASSAHISAEESEVSRQESVEKECKRASSTEKTPEGAVSASGEKEILQEDNSSSGGDSGKPSPGKETVETAKEPTKKLSAAAPPFNPSTIPVFGSIVIPGFKEQCGILPPPVNVPPMMTMSPVRKHPHHSATARVPYGPRLAGGYGRSGHRGPRNKPGLQNGETLAVDGGWSGPKIMNPNAAEFVPGQPWAPNGNPSSPNRNATSPNSSIASSAPVTVGASETSEVLVEEERIEKDIGNNEDNVEKQNLEDEECISGKNEEIETENSNATDGTSEAPVVGEETPDAAVIVEKPGKCWADYSDGEADVVEVLS